MSDFEAGMKAADLEGRSTDYKKGYWCHKCMNEIAELLVNAISSTYDVPMDTAENAIDYEMLQQFIQVHLLKNPETNS